jgi:hypothetical protein
VKLGVEQSAALRQRLLNEVVNITSADLAAGWARAALPAKNTLKADDANVVEDAFERRLQELAATETGVNLNESQAAEERDPETVSTENASPSRPRDVGSLSMVVTVRRHRNREHLRYVAQQPCLVCGRKPSDPHHLRFAQPRALGRKASDEFAVPLCRIHHRLLHRVGNEGAWWQEVGIDPLNAARKLWKRTRLDRPKADSANGPIGSKEAKLPDSASDPSELLNPPSV